MKKAVVIGANGYIARNLITKLKDQYLLELYDIQENHRDGNENYSSVDITNIDSVREMNLDCDIIYNFAGMTGTTAGFEKYDQFIQVNEIGLLNLLTVYVEQKSGAKIVFPSTRLVYKGIPGNVSGENADKEFKTIYAINKYSCEQYLKMYHEVYGVEYCIVRICLPYGTMIEDAGSYGTAEFFASKGKRGEDITIYGDGSQRRTLIHMEDLCNILRLCGENEQCVNDVYNIGGADHLSLYEMASVFADIYGVNVVSVPWPEIALKIESGDTVFDSSKLDKLIEYRYKHNIKEWADATNGQKHREK